MTTNHLRATLLKIQDRLSNDDRKRLHFFLANEVPRTIRDDQSLGGTLNLLESLFDQAKISEENFHLLIHAFTQIRCREAVSILKGMHLFSNYYHRTTHVIIIIMIISVNSSFFHRFLRRFFLSIV